MRRTSTPLQGAHTAVSIRLTDAQLERIGRRSPVLRFWLSDVRPTLTDRAEDSYDDPTLTQTLLRGFVVLASLPADRGYMDSTTLANELGYSTRDVARYLKTLEAIGVVERHPTTRTYRHAQ